MTLADNLKPVVYNLRNIAGKLGFRPFTVTVVVRETTDPNNNIWDGAEESYTETEYPITHQDGYAPRVRWLNQRDYAIGADPDAILEVGPITPDHIKDGYEQGTSYDLINAVDERDGVSVYYIVNGPGLNNAKFEKTAFLGEQTLGYYIQLKRHSND